MKYCKIRIQGLGPFRELVELDLEALRGPLIAVTGRNGSGKSTALELLAGALYRSTPTRGSLRDLATRRDAFVEVELDDGLRIRQSIDAVSGKGEALILRGDEVLVESGKVRDADAWIAAHLPPASVTFASTFGVQGSGGFADLSPSDRKAVVLRTLGLERLERLAAAARERGRECGERFAVLDARLADCREGLDVDGLEETLGEARAELPDLEVEVERTGQALELAKLRGELRARRLRCEQDLEAVRRDRDATARILGSADAIGEAVVERSSYLAEAHRVDLEAVAVTAKGDEARAEHAGARQRWEDGRERVRELEAQAEAVRVELVRRARLEDAPERVRALELELAAAEEELTRHEDRLAAGRATLRSASSARISGLREGLEDVRAAPTVERAGLVATCALEDDDGRRDHAAALPEALEERAAHVARDRAHTNALRSQLTGARVEAERLEALATPADAELLERRLGELREVVRVEHAAGASLAPKIPAARVLLAELERRGRELRAQALELEPVAQRAAELDRAAGRLEELERNVTAGEDALGAAVQALQGAQEAPDVPTAERASAEARRILGAARVDLGRLEAGVAAAAAAGLRRDELEAAFEPLAGELADWTLLGQSLGRSGLQAALIDAAGPELTVLVNDLLHSCVGPRWSIEVRTTRSKASGRGELEVLDLVVIDTVEGREGEIASYSGGERVILGEAVALALATLARRRAGVEEGATIIRDESGAALDEERLEQWVAMIRRAAELVGASRVLLVTHSPIAAALCDSTILVEDRQIRAKLGA